MDIAGDPAVVLATSLTRVGHYVGRTRVFLRCPHSLHQLHGQSLRSFFTSPQNVPNVLSVPFVSIVRTGIPESSGPQNADAGVSWAGPTSRPLGCRRPCRVGPWRGHEAPHGQARVARHVLTRRQEARVTVGLLAVSQLEKKQALPPFQPQITDDYGLDNFDTQFTSEPVQLTPDDE